jgi:hypothetical protein
MTQNDSEPKFSPELKKLQQPGQSSIRTGLRIAGPVIFLTGAICTIIGLVSFFASFGSMEMPHYFWLAFIGMPLMFVGGVMCQFGFIGAVARFIAGESAPVAADTVNYMAEETRGAVETLAKSAAKGVVEGIEGGRNKTGQGKD